MKKVLFFAVAAAMFAACSNTDELASLQGVQTNDAQGNPVNFDVYAGRAATRAGMPGNDGTSYGITTTTLQTGFHKAGFGVFGYYTSNDTYDTNSSTPNFFYNQPVVYKSSKWTYEPVKYWPNEFGDGANSDDVDYLTFFAYAPFVDVTYNTGIPVAKVVNDAEAANDPENYITAADACILLGTPSVSTAADWATLTGRDASEFQAALDEQVQKFNITQLNKNTQTGDAIVKYVVDTKPATSVDLLWGVAAESNGYKGEHGETIKDGSCYVDLTKQNDVTKKVKWNFKHALARLNVQIVNAVDEKTAATYTPGGTQLGKEGDGTVETKKLSGVFVRSISFNGFAMKGALNLHSEEPTTPGVANAMPNWMAYDGTNELMFETVTFNDGLKDGKEGTTNNADKKEGVSVLNPVLLQESSVTGAGELKTQGVPVAWTNLFAGAVSSEPEKDPIYVIPSGEPLDITIAYDVETIDENLANLLSDNINHGHVSQNVIYKTNVLAGAAQETIQPGYTYVIKIILGLESVKFDVTVTGWGTAAESEISLPDNH